MTTKVQIRKVTTVKAKKKEAKTKVQTMMTQGTNLIRKVPTVQKKKKRVYI